LIPKVAQPVKEHLPDYEVELTVVMGKDAKNVSEADALDYVLGYVTGNDVSYTILSFMCNFTDRFVMADVFP
jgi:2-keto-4-pentenoate hydratase/2-oxohepta-3-ene-1,7-dioic acid hydratase in catechol pathway